MARFEKRLTSFDDLADGGDILPFRDAGLDLDTIPVVCCSFEPDDRIRAVRERFPRVDADGFIGTGLGGALLDTKRSGRALTRAMDISGSNGPSIAALL